MRNIVNGLAMCTASLLFVGYAYAEVSVTHAWVRMPPSVADTAAVYMNLHNDGDKDAVMVGLTIDVADTAEFHTVIRQGGQTRMEKISTLTIPANGVVKLEPFGMHIMLLGLKRELHQGQTTRMALHFASGKDLEIIADVRDMRPVQNIAQGVSERAMAQLGKGHSAEALALFQQAAEQGNRQAQYQLGLMYARGEGVKKNFSQARGWLRKSALQGHPKAQFYLGRMYAFGDGGEQDYVEATIWFWLATTLGDRYAKDNLKVMSGKISRQQLMEAKSRAETLWKDMPYDMKVKRSSAMH